jgi:hypothetical protein
MKIRPVGAELFHEGGQTDMTTILVAFRNFVKAPKNGSYYRKCVWSLIIHVDTETLYSHTPGIAPLFDHRNLSQNIDHVGYIEMPYNTDFLFTFMGIIWGWRYIGVQQYLTVTGNSDQKWFILATWASVGKYMNCGEPRAASAFHVDTPNSSGSVSERTRWPRLTAYTQ